MPFNDPYFIPGDVVGSTGPWRPPEVFRDRQIPNLPFEFPQQSTLVVRAAENQELIVKVAVDSETSPEPADLESFKASEAKNLFFESLSLGSKLNTALLLAKDMMERSQSLGNKELSAQIKAIESPISDLLQQASKLYEAAGLNAYPIEKEQALGAKQTLD